LKKLFTVISLFFLTKIFTYFSFGKGYSIPDENKKFYKILTTVQGEFFDSLYAFKECLHNAIGFECSLNTIYNILWDMFCNAEATFFRICSVNTNTSSCRKFAQTFQTFSKCLSNAATLQFSLYWPFINSQRIPAKHSHNVYKTSHFFVKDISNMIWKPRLWVWTQKLSYYFR